MTEEKVIPYPEKYDEKGAGTIQPLNKATYSVGVSMKEAPVKNAIDSEYADFLPHLERIQEELSTAKEEELEPINRAKVSLLTYK